MANNDKLVRRWATETLRGLGITPTARNVRAMVGWQHAEGGHTNNQARWNFLNTTLNLPGSGDTGSQGNISVYKSFDQGVEATIKTLKLPAYAGIRKALQHGSPRDVANAIGSSPWGTSAGLVSQTIAGTGAVRPTNDQAPSSSPSPAPSPQYQTTPGVDNSAERQQLLRNYLPDRGRPGALLNLALGLQQAQDTPSTRVRIQGSQPASHPGQPSNSTGGRPVRGELYELIWRGPGSQTVKNGQRVDRNFYNHHEDHVHVGAKQKDLLVLGRLAQRMGLHVGENPAYGGVNPVHVSGSFHYGRHEKPGENDRAIDVSGGTPQQYAKFARKVARLYGI